MQPVKRPTGEVTPRADEAAARPARDPATPAAREVARTVLPRLDPAALREEVRRRHNPSGE